MSVVSFMTRPLYPAERSPGTHWAGVWMAPRASMDDTEKLTFLTLGDSNSDLSVVQPVASHCTDCATEVHKISGYTLKIRVLLYSFCSIGNWIFFRFT
jgi:hypothetical protein